MSKQTPSNADFTEMAMRVHREEGKGYVRDIQSNIFDRPLRGISADFDGDTPSFIQSPPQLPLGKRLHRQFNNMSLKRKNLVRKIQKKLKQASKRSAAIMHGNMRKLHDK